MDGHQWGGFFFFFFYVDDLFDKRRIVGVDVD